MLRLREYWTTSSAPMFRPALNIWVRALGVAITTRSRPSLDALRLEQVPSEFTANLLGVRRRAMLRHLTFEPIPYHLFAWSALIHFFTSSENERGYPINVSWFCLMTETMCQRREVGNRL
jgi:hypothetical protein